MENAKVGRPVTLPIPVPALPMVNAVMDTAAGTMA